jgi:hypothetical protein
MNDNLDNLATFVDVENASTALINSAFECLRSSKWRLFLRQGYGSCLTQRQEVLRANGIKPVEVFRNTSSPKNSSDIALTIAVMKELHRGYADGYAIVSSDSDMTALAEAIRECGKYVLVFGNENTPLSLRMAASEFHLLKDNMNPDEKLSSQVQAQSCQETMGTPDPHNNSLRLNLQRFLNEQTVAQRSATIDVLSQIIRKSDPAFSPKRYGARSMSTLLRKLGGFTLRPIRNGSGTITNYGVEQA